MVRFQRMEMKGLSFVPFFSSVGWLLSLSHVCKLLPLP